MPGFFGCIGNCNKNVPVDRLIETINPLSISDTKILRTNEALLAVTWLNNNPLLFSRYYEDENYVALFSGDLIGFQEVPWPRILTNVGKATHDKLSDYKGTFAIAIHDKITKHVSIISDRRSQEPLYYLINQNGFIFSTAMSTYCKLPDVPEFNANWLYEFLFFNYPIGQTTFLKDILRMPPASVLEYDLRTCKASLSEYAKPFKKPNKLAKGREAFEKAWSVFNERVPKYFQKDTKVAVSLTAGFDSRTVLSFAPLESKGSLVTYTYGIPGCYDLVEASKFTSALQLPHKKITFDNNYLDILQNLIYKTVYLSEGLQGINRSTLPYVYEILTNKGQSFPVIITGTSGDHLFRDHIRGSGNVPSLISSDMMKIFSKGQIHISKSFFRKACGDNFSKFQEHIYKMLDFLKSKYGDLSRPESYLSYLIYEIAPKYFAGEAAIANNYSTFRTPYWDEDIIKLSYEIEYGTLGFSESFVKKDKYRECVLQAFLIQRNKNISKTPIRNIPLSLFSNNNKFHYNLYRIVHKGPQKIKSILQSPPPSLEDWSNWFGIVLNGEIAKLITKESLITNYLTTEFIEEVKDKNDVHWLGKIATAELILRLIKNRWKI